jgi:hypothetical protein
VRVVSVVIDVEAAFSPVSFQGNHQPNLPSVPGPVIAVAFRGIGVDDASLSSRHGRGGIPAIIDRRFYHILSILDNDERLKKVAAATFRQRS